MKISNFNKRSVETKSHDQQRRLEEIVTSGGWRLLKPGELFDPNFVPTVAIVGVTTWDNLAMQALETMKMRGQSQGGSIVVFNLDDYPTVDALTKILPQVAPVLQSPVIAEYRGGQLVRKLEGKEARDWMGGKSG